MKLDGGSVLTTQRFTQILEEEMTQLRSKLGAQRFDGGHFTQVRDSTRVWIPSSGHKLHCAMIMRLWLSSAAQQAGGAEV